MFTRYLTIITILLTSALFADENRIKADSKQLTEETKKDLFEHEFLNEKKESVPTIYDNRFPPVIPNHYTHNLAEVSLLYDYLILEDGSQWNIKPSYSKEAMSWREKDPIIIIKNSSFFPSYFNNYQYKMINARTNATIEVNLQLAPILENSYTLQVAAINPITCLVILSDNSLWQCDPSQKSLLNDWLITDGIIIGTNIRGCFGAAYENLLINVKMLQDIKANRKE